MPFSFIEIEESKNRVIAVVFLFIILFYFLTAYLLLIVVENSFGFYISESKRSILFLPPIKHTLFVLIMAFVAGLLHWLISISNLISKISSAIGAKPIDPKDTYHQYFQNIVGEVSVAMGGRPIEAMIIRSPGLNAFSLEGFDKRAVIGVTEGLLARLNRNQIEAVVAHEAGHIIGGDSLTTTVISSLSEIYEEGFAKLRKGMARVRGRGALFILLLLIVLGIMNFLSRLLRYFISRQREYRADAIAVRLTRNPLSLAEALKLISKYWHGSGAQGERIGSIFIINPRYSRLDEREGLMSNIFSTHPPVRNRINILLSMAHLDEKTLEENLKKFQRISPVAVAEFKPADSTKTDRWFILKEQKWLGPFLLNDLINFQGLRPDQWVRMEGQDVVMPAYEYPALRDLFSQRGGKQAEFCCPHCKAALEEVNYEGAPILKCSFCEGAFVGHDKINRILVRRDVRFSEDTERLAQTIINSRDKFRLKEFDAKSAWAIECPKCKNPMRRQFFVHSYPVEIDRCINCSGIWFDNQELEILQYLYEHKDLAFSRRNP